MLCARVGRSVFAVTFTDSYPMQTGEITFTADGRAFQSRSDRFILCIDVADASVWCLS